MLYFKKSIIFLACLLFFFSATAALAGDKIDNFQVKASVEKKW